MRDCMINGCAKPARSSGATLCEMHYYRVRRTGKSKLTERTRSLHSNGYVRIKAYGHPVSWDSGWAYEHRVKFYDHCGGHVSHCELCGYGIDWGSCHIDHINEIKTDNRLENLRPLCAACNMTRNGAKDRGSRKRSMEIEVFGQTMTTRECVDLFGLDIDVSTIQRRLKAGHSGFVAAFAAKVTHKSTGCRKLVSFN